MSDKELKEMGITPRHKLYPTQYWVNAISGHIKIPKGSDIEYVLTAIYNSGYDNGVMAGKEIRSKQFNDLINNMD